MKKLILVTRDSMVVGFFNSIEDFAVEQLDVEILDDGTVVIDRKAMSFEYDMFIFTKSEILKDVCTTQEFKKLCKDERYRIYDATIKN